jgi:hypothetical protein
VRFEGLGKLKKKLINLIESRTRDLPACSIMPQERCVKYQRVHLTPHILYLIMGVFNDSVSVQKPRDIHV